MDAVSMVLLSDIGKELLPILNQVLKLITYEVIEWIKKILEKWS